MKEMYNMNLRDEITKAEENEKKRKEEIQKLEASEEYKIRLSFKKFCKGEEIEDSYKEKILDELQKCIDNRTIKNSVLENDIATRFDKKNLPVELKVAFKIIEENEIIRENLDEINEVFKSNEISELDFDYTIEDIEDRVIQYILKEIEKHTPAGIIFLTENNEQGSSYYDLQHLYLDTLFDITEERAIEDLIILKNKNYYLLENDRLIDNWCLILYIKYLLKNKKIIYEKTLPKIPSDYELDDLSKYGINYITPDDSATKEEKEARSEALWNVLKNSLDNPPTLAKLYQNEADREKNFKSVNEDEFFKTLKENINNKYTGIFYDDKIDLEEAIQEYNRGKNFNNNLCEYMKKDIYSIISSIMKISLRSKEKYDEDVKQALDEIQVKLKDIKMYYKYSSQDMEILIIKNNIVLKFYIDIKINDHSIDIGSCRGPRIGIISEKDRIIIDKEHVTYKKKNTVYNTPSYSSLQKKQHSVIGRAVAGAIIAGPAGGVIGAISAVDKNISSKQSNNYANVKAEPIVVEYDRSYDRIEFIFHFNEYSFQLINWKIYIDDNDDESDLIDVLINTFLPENLLKGKILYEYIHNSNDFKLGDADMYVKITLSEIKEHKKELYWQEHKEEKQKLETEIEDYKKDVKAKEHKISDLKQDKKEVEKKINTAPSEKELKTLNDKEVELKEKKSSLGLFKVKERKTLQEQIDEYEQKIEQVNKKISEEKTELKNQYEPDLNRIDSQIEELDKEIEKIKKKIDDNEAELNKEIE